MKKKGTPAPKQEKEQESEKVKVLQAQLARALADYDNLGKRVERERLELVQYAGTRIVKNLLPILDMLEQAQKHVADPGLTITLQQFREVLKLEGYEEIKTKVGDEFDENLHEVIEVVPGESENTVSEVIQSGWTRSDGFVIRPVKVKVFKK